jgi:cytochrome c peroxidase
MGVVEVKPHDDERGWHYHETVESLILASQDEVRSMFVRFATAILLLMSFGASAESAEPLLQEQLAKEPVAELAKAARARGDAARGAVLFFQPFLTCAKCHDGDTGTQLGPDIAKAGKEASPCCTRRKC